MDVSKLVEEGGKFLAKKSLEVVVEMGTKELIKNMAKLVDEFKKQQEKKRSKKEKIGKAVKQEIEKAKKGSSFISRKRKKKRKRGDCGKH
jgi:hypothetical protein